MTSLFGRVRGWVGSRRAEAGAATAGALAVVFVGTMAIVPRPGAQWPTAEARRQPFVEVITEVGTVATLRVATYSSTVTAGAATIVELAPEGQVVQAGDVLFRLDATPFERALVGERAALRQAEAELTRVIEEARLELFRSQGDLEAAAQLMANAERALANETSGKGQLAVLEAEAALAEAERALAKARADVGDLKPLLAEQFITAAEFETAARALKSAEDHRRLAAARRDSVVRFERPAATSKAEAEVSNTRGGFLRERESAQARAAQRQAMVGIARSRLDEIRARIAALSDQIDRTTVRALGPGLVVHRELFFGNDQRKPQIGDEVLPNQAFLSLPDSSQMVVDTRVREVDLHKVAPMQQVRVHVDAYPDLELRASVTAIGPLAQEDAARAGAKFFPVTVKLSSSDARLRTGMTARVEIQVSSAPSAVVIPVQALFDDRGDAYVVSLRAGRPERRAVKVTASNESVAAIGSGVAAGDRILLVDPTVAERPR